MNDTNNIETVKTSVPSQVCSHCGSANCVCKGGNCPFGKADRILCMILKVVKIIVFIALAYVLFDIHTVIKQSQRNYAKPSAGNMPPAGMVMQPSAGQPQ